MTLPYLTSDLPGTGGTLRNRPEDFFVQEVPLYEPSGEGEHLYVEIQKVGLTTREAVNRVATALELSPKDIGVAGLKDRHAVTRQTLSLWKKGLTEEQAMTTPIEGVQVLWADWHANKLKTGHLAGNRFAIKIRDVDPTAVLKLRPLLDRLEKEGLPNYYGEQRFGSDSHRPNDVLGVALTGGDYQQFCDLLLGGEDGREDVAAARKLYDEGNREAALEAWPDNIQPEKRVLKRLVKTGDPEQAAKAMDKGSLRFYTSAAQSAIFNALVARRVKGGTLAQILLGDVATKHKDALITTGSFVVEDPIEDQPRCDAWEISPTGPMPGKKMHPRAAEEAEMIEKQVYAELGVRPGLFDSLTGTRRPIRVRPTETRLASGVDEHGQHITVAFTLPAGCYATTLLREIMKSD